MACVLSESMFKKVEDIFQIVINPELFELKFTKENLIKLDKIIESKNIQFTYKIYSDNRKMNVDTKYATNRRVWFSGNFLINLWGASSLELIDFDVIKRDALIPEKEQSSLFTNILKSCVKYAKELQLDNVTLRLQVNNIKLTDPQVSFLKLTHLMDTTDEVNHYLLMEYKAAYKCGFRLDDFTTRHRKPQHDFLLKKRIS